MSFDTSATASAPLVLVQHGTNDEAVSLEQVQQLVATLERAGCRVEFHTFDYEGHNFGAWKQQHCIAAPRRSAAFLEAALLAGEGR